MTVVEQACGVERERAATVDRLLHELREAEQNLDFASCLRVEAEEMLAGVSVVDLGAIQAQLAAAESTNAEVRQPGATSIVRIFER